MAHKIPFAIVSTILVSFTAGFFVLAIALLSNSLAVIYPLIVLGMAALTAYLYKRRIGQEQYRLVVLGIVAAASAVLASIPVFVIERYASVIALETGSSLMVASLPVSGFVHALLFVVLFFIPALLFPCPHDDVRSTKDDEPAEFKEIEDAVKEREREQASKQDPGNDAAPQPASTDGEKETKTDASAAAGEPVQETSPPAKSPKPPG